MLRTISMATVEAPLGPGLKASTGEIRYPFQELKERFAGQHFSTTLVLGEGPVKDIVFSHVATDAQKKEWEVFSANPREAEKEPTFRMIETVPQRKDKNGYNALNPHARHFQELNRWVDILLDESKTLFGTPDYAGIMHDYNQSVAQYQERLQEVGPLVKRRWGEANALAGGLLLYLGVTDKLILTGGRTGGTSKPSEAQAMQDVIVREFGRLFFEKEAGQKVKPENKDAYKRFIEEDLKPRLLLEEDAPNTIGNVAKSANKYPEYFLEESSLALVTSGHHLNRGKLLIERITGREDVAPISAQEVLEWYGEDRRKGTLVEIEKTYQLGEGYSRQAKVRDYRNKLGRENLDLTSKVKGEEQHTKRLERPEDITFWGYVIGKLEDPRNVQSSMKVLESSPQWRYAATELFKLAGLDYAAYQGVDLVELSQDNPEKFQALKMLAGLENDEIRKMVLTIPQEVERRI